MRFISLFGVLAAAATVSATTNSTEIETIAQDLKNGDLIGAVFEILTLGDCDVVNLADCASAFGPLVVDCAVAAGSSGGNPLDDLKCIADVLTALGSNGTSKCEACIEEGLAIAESLI